MVCYTNLNMPPCTPFCIPIMTGRLHTHSSNDELFYTKDTSNVSLLGCKNILLYNYGNYYLTTIENGRFR